MSNVKTFKTICNETTRYPDGKSSHTISAVCDKDGAFAIHVSGNGGADGAKSAITRVLEILGCPRGMGSDEVFECEASISDLSVDLEKAIMALEELIDGYAWDYEPSASKALEWESTVSSYQENDEDAKHSCEYLHDYKRIMWLIRVAFDYCYSAIDMAKDIGRRCSDAISFGRKDEQDSSELKNARQKGADQ